MAEKPKRNIAYKFRIGSVLAGKPLIENNRFLYLKSGEKNIVRVNIIGNVIDKYESSGEKKFCFATIDDGSGQIKLKSFGDDIEKLKNIIQGQTVLVIGTLRNFNNETYISPEIIRESDPRYLLVRKMETQKEETSETNEK